MGNGMTQASEGYMAWVNMGPLNSAISNVHNTLEVQIESRQNWSSRWANFRIVDIIQLHCIRPVHFACR